MKAVQKEWQEKAGSPSQEFLLLLLFILCCHLSFQDHRDDVDRAAKNAAPREMITPLLRKVGVQFADAMIYVSHEIACVPSVADEARLQVNWVAQRRENVSLDEEHVARTR